MKVSKPLMLTVSGFTSKTQCSASFRGRGTTASNSGTLHHQAAPPAQSPTDTLKFNFNIVKFGGVPRDDHLKSARSSRGPLCWGFQNLEEERKGPLISHEPPWATNLALKGNTRRELHVTAQPGPGVIMPSIVLLFRLHMLHLLNELRTHVAKRRATNGFLKRLL